MPPENPYAAPQVIDQPIPNLPEWNDEVVASLETIRDGARLALKSLWLTLLAILAVVAGGLLPEMGDLMGWGMLLLLGAAAFCFLISIALWYRVHPAAGIQGLMIVAASSYALVLLMSLTDHWLIHGFSQSGRIAWLALSMILSLAYFVSFMLGAARLGTFVQDRAVSGSAAVAAWAWGLFYAILSGFYLLALIPAVREKIVWIYTKEGQPALIAGGVFLVILALVGLVGYIWALWRLKKVDAA